MSRPSCRLANVLPALALCLVAAGCGAPAGTAVLKAGHESWFLGRAVEARDRVAADCPGLQVQGIRIDGDRVRIQLTHGAATTEVRMAHPAGHCRDCLVSRHFAVDFDPADACAAGFAGALHRGLQATDVPGVWMRVGRPPFATGAGVWLFLAGWLALAVGVAALGRRHAGWDMVLLALAAVGVRLALATWGPGDLQLNLHPEKANVYGPAPYAVAWALERLLRPDDLVPVLVAASAALGGAAVLIVALFLREAGASRRVALAAALLLAIHPVAIRLSGDCERQMYVLAAQAAALLAVAAAHFRGRWWPLAVFVLAGVLGTYSRPEGVAVWGAAAFVTLLLPWSRKTAFVVVVAAAGIGLGVLRYAGDFLVQVRSASTALDFLPPVIADPGFTPVVAILLFAAGAALAVRARDRLLAGLAVLALLASLPALFHPTWGMRLASTRYQLQALVPFVAVAAFGLAALGRIAIARFAALGRPAFVPVVVALIVAASVPAMLRVTRPVSVDNEFAFLRRALPLVPRGAVIFFAHPDGRVGDVAGFRGMVPLSDWVGRGDIRWRLWDESAPATPPPAFFYRQPACLLPTDPTEDAPPGDPGHECLRCVVDRCRQGMAHSRPEALAETTFPAVHFGLQRFVADEATVGLYPLAPTAP